MRLSELLNYDPITIQCHDNPDADAIASGFGLYTYFTAMGKRTRLVYSGPNQIQKTNLRLMVERLEIPIEYVPEQGRDGGDAWGQGLLIAVDCQYGAGNITGLSAGHVAIIDHHQVEIEGVELSEIRSNLGSCSTLVWKMLGDESFDISGMLHLGTALYYGLFSDTNQFSEIYNPVDMDMRDSVPCEKSLINLFRNSNLSLKELEIAGIAMLRYIYNDDYCYAIIRAEPCDPNILGLISDFLLQVDTVHTCIVYNDLEEGYKLSVRSCVKEVNANELAAFLTAGIGSGGGHREKAGGFVQKILYEQRYPTLHSEAYFSQRMNEYFDNCDIIHAAEYDIDTGEMKKYRKKSLPIGYVVATDVLPVNTPITIRTLEGDVDMTVEPDLIIMIGIKGEVYPNRLINFEQSYRRMEQKYDIEEYTIGSEYIPTIKNRADGTSKTLTDYAHVCVPTGETYIHARELTKRMKVFTAWDSEKYMVGKPGDYLAVRCTDLHDIYVVERGIFHTIYEAI